MDPVACIGYMLVDNHQMDLINRPYTDQHHSESEALLHCPNVSFYRLEIKASIGLMRGSIPDGHR